MRVVVVGASGFLGSALSEAIAGQDVDLLCTARDAEAASRMATWPQERTRWISADFADVPPVAFWTRHLLPGDIVINAAGVLRERRAGEFEAVHHEGPARLFDACVNVGASLVIQISALGASEAAVSPYHRSKGKADAHLMQSRVASVIVQPSLIWSDHGASARFFAALAVLPLIALPSGGPQALQPVHLQDVVEGVVALIDVRPVRTRTIAFVGPAPVSLREYLGALRRQLGYDRPAWMLSIPDALFRAGAVLAGAWRGSFLDADTAGMLLRGNVASSVEFARWLRRDPRPPSDFISPARAEPMRRTAWLTWLLPLLRCSVAAVWIWTFVVSIGLYPREQSLALLARLGAEGGWAELLLTGAAVFDLALGIATLVLTPAWRSRLLWPLQLLLIGFYTVAISGALPEFWLHPFGPISKNLPMCAAIALLWAMEPPVHSSSRRG